MQASVNVNGGGINGEIRRSVAWRRNKLCDAGVRGGDSGIGINWRNGIWQQAKRDVGN